MVEISVKQRKSEQATTLDYGQLPQEQSTVRLSLLKPQRRHTIRQNVNTADSTVKERN